MITPDSVIDLLGGTKAVASALSLPLQTVSTWRKRGIPSSRWLPLSRLAEERGVEGAITLDSLARMAAAAEEAART